MPRWPTYHKPSAEQHKAVEEWLVAYNVPEILWSSIRRKFRQLNWPVEKIKTTTPGELLYADVRMDCHDRK